MVESWKRGLSSLRGNSQLCYECERREQRIVLRPRTGLNGGERGQEQVSQAKRQRKEVEDRPRTNLIFFFCGAVRARSSDGHQSICNDCPFPRMRKSETIPKVSLEPKATSNKQKQHKTATNHKQQTNNPGHLAKKSETLRFQKYPLVSQYCSTTK